MNKRRLALAAMLLLAGTVVRAAELDYTVRAGVNHSDNIERLPDGMEQSAAAAVVGLEVRGERPTGRLRYLVATDLSYFDYLDLGLNSELLGDARLRGAYDFVPGSVSWNGTIAYDQIREDLLRPSSPGNREEQVTLSTGPTVRARLGGAMEAQFDGNYTVVRYSDRPFDYEALGGRLLVGRRSGPRSFIALGVSRDDVSYTANAAPTGLDFDRSEAFVHVELDGARTAVAIEAGYFDVSGETVDDDGALLRARLSRQLTPALSAFLHANREYQTSEPISRSLVDMPTGGSNPDSSVLTAASELRTGAGAGLRLDYLRTQAELAYERRKEDASLIGAGLREVDEVRAYFRRRLTPRVDGSVYGGFTQEDLSFAASKAKERTLGMQLGANLGRALGVELRVEHHKRNGVLATDDYSELTAGLFVRYNGAIGRSTTAVP